MPESVCVVFEREAVEGSEERKEMALDTNKRNLDTVRNFLEDNNQPTGIQRTGSKASAFEIKSDENIQPHDIKRVEDLVDRFNKQKEPEQPRLAAVVNPDLSKEIPELSEAPQELAQ